MPRMLIIEDDPALAEMLALHFEEQGMVVQTALNCAEGLRQCRDTRPDLVLLDQQLPDGAGIELLQDLIACEGEPAIIMMTGKHDLELAIEAIKQGAADFIHKPIQTDVLEAAVDKTLARRVSRAEPCPPPQASERELIGRSTAMLEVSKQIALAAAADANVLILGESGTGKEVVARLIHRHSERKGPFVPLNCAAIVESLLESELFGHERGAFTGADRQKQGKFELAEGGTLFLDEIGEMAPGLQAKLLRALQERTIERVGGSEGIAVDVRIIAATHRDLFELVRKGDFREDLAYRLNVIRIELPPLRERREDIPLLAQALLDRIALEAGACPPPLSQAVLDRLQSYPWPGNVRELENTLTLALVRARNGAILPEYLSLGEHGLEHPEPSDQEAAPLKSLDQVEAEHIQRVLNHTGGHKGRSCKILGISRPALDRKIRKYDLRLPRREKTNN